MTWPDWPWPHILRQICATAFFIRRATPTGADVVSVNRAPCAVVDGRRFWIQHVTKRAGLPVGGRYGAGCDARGLWRSGTVRLARRQSRRVAAKNCDVQRQLARLYHEPGELLVARLVTNSWRVGVVAMIWWCLCIVKMYLVVLLCVFFVLPIYFFVCFLFFLYAEFLCLWHVGGVA